MWAYRRRRRPIQWARDRERGLRTLGAGPKLSAWWGAVLVHEAVARVNGEIEKALQEFLAQGN